MADNDPVQQFIHRLDYSQGEIRQFTQGPHRVRFVRNRSQFPSTACIAAEIVQSAFCRAGYAPGDQFVVDLNGGLVLEDCPRCLCAHLISQFAVPVALICERISEALNPDEFHFNRMVRCAGTGVECSRHSRVMARLCLVKSGAARR